MDYQELITEEEYEQQLKELNDKRTRYLLAWQNSETEEQKNANSAKILEIDNLITDSKRRYQESCEFEKNLMKSQKKCCWNLSINHMVLYWICNNPNTPTPTINPNT